MNKAVIAAIVVVVGIGLVAGGMALYNSNDTPEPTQQEQDGITEIDVTTFSLEEIALHSTADDCWTAVGGSVYDITNYIPGHPGGEEILLACGTDGTALFGTRTTDDGEQIGSGTPHSTNAVSQLGQFFIGSLEIEPSS